MLVVVAVAFFIQADMVHPALAVMVVAGQGALPRRVLMERLILVAVQEAADTQRLLHTAAATAAQVLSSSVTQLLTHRLDLRQVLRPSQRVVAMWSTNSQAQARLLFKV
jgi:D-alanyl-D-alanine dipeptidase